jgi:hypothetical protein
LGRIFLTVLPVLGLGFFCGPLLDLASLWKNQVPGGVLALGSFTLALGVSMLTIVEGMSYSEAVHLCVITGKMIVFLIGLFENLLLTDLNRLKLNLHFNADMRSGTTIGYGNITPSSDLGRFSLAIYAIMICNVMGGLLDIGRQFLEPFCRQRPREKKTDEKVE